jgi:hypothetical protein
MMCPVRHLRAMVPTPLAGDTQHAPKCTSTSADLARARSRGISLACPHPGAGAGSALLVTARVAFSRAVCMAAMLSRLS